MFRILQLVAVFVASIIIFTSAALAGVEGLWEGEVSYQGDNLPVRIEIQNIDGVLSAKLDLPTLVYAGQPVAIEKLTEDQVKINFPFGIGDIAGQLKGGEIISDEGAVGLVLRKGTPPPYSTKDISFGLFGPDIKGTLFVPQGEGLFPVVVLLAGSGAATHLR